MIGEVRRVSRAKVPRTLSDKRSGFRTKYGRSMWVCGRRGSSHRGVVGGRLGFGMRIMILSLSGVVGRAEGLDFDSLEVRECVRYLLRVCS